MSNLFTPGQRWLSDAEPALGLGTLVGVEGRAMTLNFSACDEQRTYALQSAPLTRAEFAAGDRVQSSEGWWLEVEQVEESGGLLTYTGSDESGQAARLAEGELDGRMQLNRPAQRLFAGQIDANHWFELRRQSREQLARLARSPLSGLTGARTALIPHQLYIAHEVAQRHAPRVLLADEVGLGKTIEAGLIIHHQLLTERAQRVLLILPENLQHQWLVEMVRRFNLRFSLFDEERCDAARDEGYENPFHSEQLVMCSLDMLLSDPRLTAEALTAGWDMLVVDEAHHLAWSPELTSPEYACVELFAERIPGVLLLTATPEQLGLAGHFARLRLLDPARFPDLDRFLTEEQAYRPVADAVRELLDDQPLDADARAVLASTLDEGDNQQLLDTLDDTDAAPELRHAAREALTAHLLDRHGTGRVLFRNTRSAVQGFPERRPLVHPLPLPDEYVPFATSLNPERTYTAASPEDAEPWWRFDPRLPWLVELLGELHPAKLLLITATAATALELAEALRVRHGIDAATFHEGMSLMERDRAAAFFADEEGSRLLVCSEIGSEGRNFQFAHHLVLFDLPHNPDLLEQRIGRLDRIGQSETVRIHLPLLEGSAGEALGDWYSRGLDAFAHTCPTGHSLSLEFAAGLDALLARPGDKAQREQLIDATRSREAELRSALAAGRDRLLELNSCRPGVAEALHADAQADDDYGDRLDYLDLLCEAYGIELEEDGSDRLILRPDIAMQQSLNGLPEEGLHATCNRSAALTNESLAYLTWEHPLLRGALEQITAQPQGNTALCTLAHPGLKPGTLLLEALYLVDAGGARRLARYLPEGYIRVLVDSQGQELAAQLPSADHATPVDKAVAQKILAAYRKPMQGLLEHAERHAASQAPALIDESRSAAERELGEEIDRLRALAVHNPSVRPEEIAALEQEREGVRESLKGARLRLDALRVVVVTG